MSKRFHTLLLFVFFQARVSPASGKTLMFATSSSQA
jgi:hypothetical protein